MVYGSMIIIGTHCIISAEIAATSIALSFCHSIILSFPFSVSLSLFLSHRLFHIELPKCVENKITIQMSVR